MSAAAWSQVFSEAFADFQHREQHHRHLPFDGYAAESPAEFFAVLSEVFFERPDAIHTDYPAVYAQLRDFYRQDPLADMPGHTRAAHHVR
jgi:Mlc titration factor MtfA (ptsG expression regulator)